MPVKLQISKDGWTKGLQLSIDYKDPKDEDIELPGLNSMVHLNYCLITS